MIVLDVITIDPATDERLAVQLHDVQRASYAVEARLIGSDRIPQLHETVDQLRGADVSWVGVLDGGDLAGALAWSSTDAGDIEIERLVVSPAQFRRGIARALVRHVLDLASGRSVTVTTGRDNPPARALYESLGFVHAGDIEVEPGLWLAAYELR
jgi:ribosomal protein S18 acetylase RimI-like enzyme